MSAEDDAMKSLGEAGFLSVLKWAAPAAFAATNQIYDEDAGHDQGVVGYLNYKHLQDHLDRATSNGRFGLGPEVEGVGGDVLERGVPPQVFRSMPLLAAHAVTRSNYRQSPGWAVGGFRVLLQSFTFGGIDDIKWVQRSDAKRRVASQHFISDGTLFDDEDFGLESIDGIPEDDGFTGVTLVAAHAFNPTTKQFELYLGQSKNPAYPHDGCWHWRVKLISGGTPIGGVGTVTPPAQPSRGASTDVEDVPVRIKRPSAAEGLGSANG
ncbi:hypothetical protein Csp2054_04150 [Curtobacterium sp. 'Ferrero']|uniref:hypothetical protein n=1 Tax=Curtobacterium sp. 'Ferrero' TaxID=2033654 RepID=UPI000BD86E66|nr:hypothetical protein [Curtobacterium sp. 'Ferrero']PCN48980.1 hypothetical protein Csp2054_04150 [Curtobacterium sp. 'Ferrero']